MEFPLFDVTFSYVIYDKKFVTYDKKFVTWAKIKHILYMLMEK